MGATAGYVAGQGTQYFDQYRHCRQQDEHDHKSKDIKACHSALHIAYANGLRLLA
jgi:hypothetical protein